MPAPAAAPQRGYRTIAHAPQPAVNLTYVAISNTLRHLHDGRKPIEIVHDDDGGVWAIPAEVMATLVNRCEAAIAARVTEASAAG